MTSVSCLMNYPFEIEDRGMKGQVPRNRECRRNLLIYTDTSYSIHPDYSINVLKENLLNDVNFPFVEIKNIRRFLGCVP